MDFDLEIISEEGECPDPLFDSIMNAMNSMKEATADKIYQKIQKEGAMNYSKPQVDRALESALKYGIFEVRNNRYRVRDDVLDDEDTVYWKLQKKRDQTPFRIQDDINETEKGPKLDPEKDNQRFRRPSNKPEECPHCGRTKRKEGDTEKVKTARKTAQKGSPKRERMKKEKMKNHEFENSKRRTDQKRKEQHHTIDEEKSAKRRKSSIKENKAPLGQIFCGNDKLEDFKDDPIKSQEESSGSDIEMLDEPENKHSLRKRNEPRSAFSSECIKSDIKIITTKRSSISIKTDSESDKTYASVTSDDQHQIVTDGFYEERPCTSRNANGKIRNAYLNSGDTFRNQYRGQINKNKGNPDWLECSDEPQGAIIQSNNVLTIEPMDTLAFKNPEQASYIS